MTQELMTVDQSDIIERVIIAGDLSKLQPADRVNYYRATCDSLGLNPLTKPFDYITLNNKLTLYATRTATDQLRARNNVSVKPIERRVDNDLGIYIVEVEARSPDGRIDFATGVVNIAGLRGDALANAFMKAETKAKRRATLSICGLGWMDETELETVPAARRTTVDDAGEIRDIAPDSGPPASDKQRRYIGALQDDLGWHSEYMAQFAKEHRIDLVALSKADAGYLIEQMKAALDEPTKVAQKPAPQAPSADLVDLPEFAAAVKRLRECERAVSVEPPPFVWSKKQGMGALALERSASMSRLYTWLLAQTDADAVHQLPSLEELDDQGLIDLAYATAGL